MPSLPAKPDATRRLAPPAGVHPDALRGVPTTKLATSRPEAKRPVRPNPSVKNVLILAQVVIGGVVGIGCALLIVWFYGIGKPHGEAPTVEATNASKPVQVAQPQPALPPLAQLAPSGANSPPVPPLPAAPAAPSTSTTPPPSTTPLPSAAPLPSSTLPLRNPAPLPGVAESSPPSAPPLPTTPSPERREKQFIESLPTAVDLPSLVQTEAAALFPAGELPDSLDWHLQDDAADIPDGGLFFFEPQTELGATWDVCFTPDSQAQPPQVTKIARLSAKEREITFQWARTPEITAIKEQLRNCLLRVSAGDDQRWIQLRKSKSLPAIKLDFNEKSSPLTFDFLGLPHADALFLEVESPCPGTFEREQNRVTAGKEITFLFDDLKGAQLRIKMLRDNDEGTLSLRVQSEFEESRGTNFELSRDKLQDMTKRWSEAFQKAKVSLAEAKATLETLQAQQRRLAAQTPSNVSERAAQQTAMLGFINRISSAADRIPVLQKRLVEMQARLEAVPQVEKFFNAHHGRTAVRFRIFAESGEHRILLVDASQ